MDLRKDFDHFDFIEVDLIPFMMQFINGEDMNLQELRENIAVAVGALGEITDHMKKFGLKQYADHDLDSVSGEVVTNIGAIDNLLSEGLPREAIVPLCKFFVDAWPRYMISARDILLRGIAPKDVLEKDRQDLDIRLLEGSIQYLFSREKGLLEGKAGYKNLSKVQLRRGGLNVEELEEKLKWRKIQVDTATVGNFISNELRNDFRDRIEADNVTLSMDVEGDEFVIRIVDDGKGMNREHLERDHLLNVEARNQKKHTFFIFDEGASGEVGDVKEMKSSGLGLANVPERFSSMGARLSTYSKRKESGVVSCFPKVEEGKEHPLASFVPDGHGTIFELRLPIVTV